MDFIGQELDAVLTAGVNVVTSGLVMDCPECDPALTH